MRLVQEARGPVVVAGRCRHEFSDEFDFCGAQRRRRGRRALLHRAVHAHTGWSSLSLLLVQLCLLV